MVNLDITSNIKQFKKQLFVDSKQVPFAAARAANDTMFMDVRPYIKTRTFPEAFENSGRAKNMVNPRNFEILKANKKRIEATFQTKGNTDYLQMQHVEGQTRRPYQGKWMLTPQIGRGRVSKYKRHKDHSPSNLLKKPDFFFGRAGNKGTGKQFGGLGSKDKNGGLVGIWQRIGKDGLKLWYVATPTQDFSDNKGSLKFYEDAMMMASKKFGERFYISYKKALRTAR